MKNFLVQPAVKSHGRLLRTWVTNVTIAWGANSNLRWSRRIASAKEGSFGDVFLDSVDHTETYCRLPCVQPKANRTSSDNQQMKSNESNRILWPGYDRYPAKQESEVTLSGPAHRSKPANKIYNALYKVNAFFVHRESTSPAARSKTPSESSVVRNLVNYSV